MYSHIDHAYMLTCAIPETIYAEESMMLTQNPIGTNVKCQCCPVRYKNALYSISHETCMAGVRRRCIILGRALADELHHLHSTSASFISMT